MIQSLDDQLKRMAHEIIEDRVEQWATYHFEKEFLPALKHEIKERLLVQILTSFERHQGIQLDITFQPKGTNDA